MCRGGGEWGDGGWGNIEETRPRGVKWPFRPGSAPTARAPRPSTWSEIKAQRASLPAPPPAPAKYFACKHQVLSGLRCHAHYAKRCEVCQPVLSPQLGLAQLSGQPSSGSGHDRPAQPQVDDEPVQARRSDNERWRPRTGHAQGGRRGDRGGKNKAYWSGRKAAELEGPEQLRRWLLKNGSRPPGQMTPAPAASTETVTSTSPWSYGPGSDAWSSGTHWSASSSSWRNAR